MWLLNSFFYGSGAAAILYVTYQLLFNTQIRRSYNSVTKSRNSVWNQCVTPKNDGLDNYRRIHYSLDNLRTEHLNLLKSQLSSSNKLPGSGANVADLFLKMLPIVALIVTTITSTYQILYTMAYNKIDKEPQTSEKINNLMTIISDDSTNTLTVLMPLAGTFIFVMIIGIVNVIYYHSRKETIENRLAIIEQILDYRKNNSNQPMFSQGAFLTNMDDIENVIFYNVPVEVWDQNTIVEHGGSVESHTHRSFTVNGTEYDSNLYRIRYR